MMKVTGLAILATLGLISGQAGAIPISYSITGNGLYDNPVGSFTYDADENKFSSVSIWSVDYYGSASGNDSNTLLRSTGSLFGTVLRLTFDKALTNSGGSVSFSGYERGGLLSFWGSVRRSGTVSGAVNVPEPSALLLLGGGLLGLGLVRRRSAAKS